MKLHEAIESGNPFRRCGTHSWYTRIPDSSLCNYTTEEVVADDWEIRLEEPILPVIVQANVWKAVVADLLRETGWEWYWSVSAVCEKLRVKLGVPDVQD